MHSCDGDPVLIDTLAINHDSEVGNVSFSIDNFTLTVDKLSVCSQLPFLSLFESSRGFVQGLMSGLLNVV